MKVWLVVIALATACRGGHRDAPNAGPQGSASSVSASPVPKLPVTDDGVAELKAIDQRIELHAKEPPALLGQLLQRAAIRGRLDDYLRALEVSDALVRAAPDDVAWRLRAQVLSRVHRFADARAALAHVADKSTAEDIEVTIAQSTGDLDRALLYRHKLANDFPGPQTITMYAATLAELGKYDDALALLPKATTAVRANTPELINWLLFQWGRIYELKGDFAIARDFYEEAHRRLPGAVETVEHLVTVLVATGDTARAKEILAPAVADNPHPSLRALAVKLGISKESAADVAAEWERYIAALPEAFSDHAARFYLDVGANPKRALELARLNFANRPTIEARSLVVEAALAAKDPAAACAEVDPLVQAPTHAAKFTAWKALSACGRTDDAQHLGKELGI